MGAALKILNNVSTCVKLHQIISKSDASFVSGVKSDIFQIVYVCRYFGLERLSQKQFIYAMFPTKCQVQNDRTNQEKTSCFLVKTQLYN